MTRVVQEWFGVENVREYNTILKQALREWERDFEIFNDMVKRRHGSIEKYIQDSMVPSEKLISYYKQIWNQIDQFVREKTGWKYPKYPLVIKRDDDMLPAYAYAFYDGASHLKVNLNAHPDVRSTLTWDNIINSLVHEYGHYLQNVFATTGTGSDTTIEGGAYWFEEFLLKKNFRNQDYIIGYYQDQLLRQARFILCVLYHTGRITRSEVLEMFQEMTLLPEGWCRREVERIWSSMKEASYYLGKYMINEYRIPMERFLSNTHLTLDKLK